ncbi:uncharacterized protein LOC116349880 [Contarinia nasturtii]|uniref:uncharacterized protein LOC116349880 n=1 Tax=Contarinia nasturtii TaxID=265458 RepID=UPI0012D4303A|nr:uncharacterized protein LOC116349880 [Contarinia nasturtii]XP_031637370.1 uncharacterized protein LOC116349880 [Contarinia nasturtii]XP_031637371.1 uncharacterized protein LOC116349880 [Contarinia nasturtii]
MEKFSHDLTLALEETSRVRAGHCWGGRRRTRSTGNLPSAPQPTEDSSSPADGPIDINECQSNSILSDSDDRQNFQLALRQPCLFGNFESDSLNENFSPTRPSTRRKRKFKRMAVEYETTPSTPGNPNPNTMFPLKGSSVKKRVMKHTNQENFRTGLFYCGKRKRSHRDRYHDYDHYRLHSSSVPRQREFFTPKSSYLEFKNRSRNTYTKPCERILPLNKNIVSKIEKISQDSQNSSGALVGFTQGILMANDEKSVPAGFNFDSAYLKNNQHAIATEKNHQPLPHSSSGLQTAGSSQTKSLSIDSTSNANVNKMAQKSGSFDSPFNIQETSSCFGQQPDISAPVKIGKDSSRKGQSRHSNHKRKQSKRSQLKMQFNEQSGMDCEFLSSSSLSSSDSEAGETNESDREGDDELTDWPGNEAMVNFASKNDFKRAKPARSSINNPIGNNKTRYTNEDCIGQEEDTLMSADEMPTPFASHLTTSQNPSESVNLLLGTDPILFPPKFSTSMQSRLTSNGSQTLSSPSTSDNPLTTGSNILRSATSLPIDIVQSHQHQTSFTSGIHATQIESEMSGETSNPFLSSILEVREIRAGCRRIRDERPGFTIFSSVNEHLARFLQDSRQSQLILPYTNTEENDKLIDLAKLYSLRIEIENSRAIFYKTINTTQSVKIDQSNMSKLFLSDYKRRCYGADGADDDPDSTEMAT